MQKRAGLMTPIMRPIMRPIIRSIIGAQGGSFSPLSYFAAGEQGVWLDASDLTTLYQDSAGTTPVTAAGQPVGKWLDKSGRGNHFTQSTAGKRPMYVRFPAGGVRNLLLNTATLSTQSVTVTAAAHTLHFTGTGTVALSGTGSGSLVGTGASNRVSLTFTPTAGTLTLTVTGSVTAAQLELGSEVTGVQTVVSSADVTEAGVADVWAVKGDGVDDIISSPAIDFSGTDKMTIWAGYMLTSSLITPQRLAFMSGFGAGNIWLYANANASGLCGIGANLGGTIGSAEIATSQLNTPYAATYTAYAGSPVTFKRNATSVTGSVTAAGNYVSTPIRIMVDSSLTDGFSSASVSSLIIRGAATDAAGITNGERWTAQRIGVTLP